MIILIRMDTQLHTPMYFFLSHLSFCDLCYSTAIGPKMLVDLLAENKSIPFIGCALQFLILCTFADSECLLLAVMAFDRYKAISNPLLYTVNMSNRVCFLLLALLGILPNCPTVRDILVPEQGPEFEKQQQVPEDSEEE
ncbi:Olfactory receptor 5W2 [Tupaia chinensis]|uniref:Olfactory receptor 5W2 n=1 Tax=Tupaia chinensis TaxID=246437 RepID=L8Y6R1_TUPCH|nr:Olfactory receptor 5W2 [Tupaia chinensis]